MALIGIGGFIFVVTLIISVSNDDEREYAGIGFGTFILFVILGLVLGDQGGAKAILWIIILLPVVALILGAIWSKRDK